MRRVKEPFQRLRTHDDQVVAIHSERLGVVRIQLVFCVVIRAGSALILALGNGLQAQSRLPGALAAVYDRDPSKRYPATSNGLVHLGRTSGDHALDLERLPE